MVVCIVLPRLFLERRVAAHLPLWWEDVENRNVLEAMVFMIFNHSEVPNCDKDEDPPAPPNTMPIGTTNGKFLKNFRAEDWPRFEERIVFIPIMEKVESQLSLIEIMKNDETFDQLRIVASRCFLDCLSLVEELEKDHFYTDAHLVATDKLFSTIDFFESVRSKKNYGILLYITSKILSKAGFSQERITEINKTFLINHLKPFLEKRVVDENDTDIVREEASLKKFFIRAMENPKTSLFVTDNEKAAETCKDCISFALQPINTELKFFKPDQLSSIRQIIVENGCGLTKRRMIGGPKNTQINCMHIKVAFMKEEFTSFFAERRKASITPAENSG
uniref:Uncharacterized protein n=2 Tax=Clytia hemisphaerica TaxID=252671 RepID=A0A7M5X2K7_9CNID